jgi:hypothetical protein
MQVLKVRVSKMFFLWRRRHLTFKSQQIVPSHMQEHSSSTPFVCFAGTFNYQEFHRTGYTRLTIVVNETKTIVPSVNGN